MQILTHFSKSMEYTKAIDIDVFNYQHQITIRL